MGFILDGINQVRQELESAFKLDAFASVRVVTDPAQVGALSADSPVVFLEPPTIGPDRSLGGGVGATFVINVVVSSLAGIDSVVAAIDPILAVLDDVVPMESAEPSTVTISGVSTPCYRITTKEIWVFPKESKG